MSLAREIETRAAEFVARRDRGDWQVQDQAELDAWLAEGAEQRVAWLRLDAAWDRAERLSVLRSPSGLPKRRVQPARQWMALAAAFALIVAVGVGAAVHRFMPTTKSYATEIGGTETVPLADGSRLQLNTNTQLRAAVSAGVRDVWLDRGEAWFEVAHDPRHPFRIHAGDRVVTVLGTKFSVRRDGEDVRVVVAEGRVRVDDLRPRATAPTTIVSRGDVLLAKADSTLVAGRTEADMNNVLSWRRGVLVFNQSTLAEAAAEFNRYNRRKLVISDEAAAAIRIGGSFQAENIDDFARLLEQGFGLKVQQKDGEIIVSS
jgi:transmembrane sensor